jgi:antiviral helicase SLH1
MPSITDGYPAESDWLAQLMQMQEAIAALKAELPITAVEEYGKDLGISDEDFSSSADDDSDIFSYGDADGDYYSSDELDEGDAGTFDVAWLKQQSRDYCSRKFAGQSPDELSENLMTALKSDMHDDALQASLADILGYEDFDLVLSSELIQHRSEIVASVKTWEEPSFGGAEDAILRLMTKGQREEALRQADIEHKSQPLGPKLAGEEANYPHIYRAYNAGNALNTFGKKYSLPVGSTEHHEKEYTEIKIPPTKVGTVGANERLVPITEMDMLCQKTFKGYKTLNRMQSLVYPVAYKTNENMLICAPTGAVRDYTFFAFQSDDWGKDCVDVKNRVKLMPLCSRYCIPSG